MTNTRDTSNNNVLIVSLVFFASVVILVVAALAIWGSPDNAIVSSAMGQIGTILVAMIGALVAFRVGTEAKTAAVESKEVAQEAKVAAVESTAASKENAQTLAIVAVQQGHAIETVAQKQDTTNKLVDGHLSGLNARIAELTQTVARLETDKAVKQVETAQIIAAVAAAVPSAVPPAGATPPHGTPVDGATVITVDPPEAATIETVPPKGKLPRPGDQT